MSNREFYNAIIKEAGIAGVLGTYLNKPEHVYFADKDGDNRVNSNEGIQYYLGTQDANAGIVSDGVAGKLAKTICNGGLGDFDSPTFKAVCEQGAGFKTPDR